MNTERNEVKIRRANLKKWFSNRSIPEKEKSYLSQLINGKGSFGEKAARRLEATYGMGDRWLDDPRSDCAMTEDFVTTYPVDASSIKHRDIQELAIEHLSILDEDDAELWLMTAKVAAKKLRAKKDGDNDREKNALDPPLERRRTSS